MRILFDNGTPRQLRRQLSGHDIETCQERGWDRLTNGELLDRAEDSGFELLITTDQGMRYQQNMSNRHLSVVVLMNTAWPRVARRTEAIRNAIDVAEPGEFTEVSI